jgi:hypothetical protein
VRAIERRSLRGDQDLRAELLRLDERAAGQRLARDPGWKAEVVLDACARTRLSAERAAVEHYDVQAFGSGIDGGGETGGAGTHDDDVEELVPRGGIEHAHAASHRLLGRIEQNGTIGADDQNVACGSAVLREHGGDGGVLTRIDHVVGITVSPEEILQPQHVGRLRVADEHRTAGARFDEPDPAQNQRAGDALAEIGFGDEERAQPLGRHENRLDVFLGVTVHQAGAAGKLRDLAAEFSRTQPCDRDDVAQAIAVADHHDAL